MASELALENVRNVRIACAAALILGFFMPWVSIWGMGIAGYKIPEIAQGLHGFGNAMGRQGDPRIIFSLIPYLVPTLAFVAIINLLSKPVSKTVDRLGLVTGAMPFLMLLYGMSQLGGDLFRVLAIGGYWTLLAGAVLIVASLEFDTIVQYQQAMSATENNSRPFQEQRVLTPGYSETTFPYDCSVCGSSQRSNVVACSDCGTANPHNPSSKDSSGSVSTGPGVASVQATDNLPTGGKHFCAQCGERITHTDNFCSQCGSSAL